jgi:hypothetical protein
LREKQPQTLLEKSFGKALRALMTVAKLEEKLKMKRQAIEARRNDGTLDGLGYRAEQVGRNWYYFPSSSK